MCRRSGSSPSNNDVERAGRQPLRMVLKECHDTAAHGPPLRAEELYQGQMC
jgi:hypothetical protein